MATPAQVSLDFHCILDRIRETTNFGFHQAEEDFCPHGCFSGLSFRMDAHLFKEKEPYRVALPFEDLFDFDVKALGSKFDEVIKFIRGCKSRPWPVSHGDPKFVDTEKSVMIEIASQIFVNLCHQVTMEKRYESVAMPNLGLMTASLGLGSTNTWHGNPDVRVRGVSICHAKGEDVGDEDSDSGSTVSDSTAVHIEGKIQYAASNLPQAVATCVVSSFTEKSNHPDKSPLIPTILIDKKSFQIILFDCEKDVLLISNAVPLSNKGRMSRSAITLLWIVLNHR